MKTEIPKNECKGCAGRDKIIERLAQKIDEQEKQLAKPKKSKMKKAA